MACALVGVKLGFPVAHVEAGLRSFDRAMPEEINRIVTDVVSDLLLVSEPAGIANLRQEGIPDDRVAYCGNVMIDSLVAQLPAARALELPRQLGLSPKSYAVVTLHRPSNVDVPERLEQLVQLLEQISSRLPVVFPVHPRTARRLAEQGLADRLARAVVVTEPLGYREFLGLVDSASLVMSDSGGVQEETTFLDIPCITLRSNTERPATLSHGTNVLAGDALDGVLELVEQARSGQWRHAAPIDGWDGHAARRIADAIERRW